MRKVLSAAFLAGAMGVAASAALANPIMPVPAAPVFSVNSVAVPVQTTVLNGYRAVRAFWLSRAIVR
jgi:hypothetical protein